ADGRLLAVVDGTQGEIAILDGESGAERHRLRPHPASSSPVQTAPGHEASGPEASGSALQSGYLGLRPRVRIALSPEGRWVAASHAQDPSAALPPVVTAWDLASGRSRTLPGSLQGDYVAFSPDGRWLVIGGVGDYRFHRVGSWQTGLVLLRDADEA